MPFLARPNVLKPSMIPLPRMLTSLRRAASIAWLAFVAVPAFAADTLLPTSPESYLSQADRVRRSHDRVWSPGAGQLGNLRHLQIAAPGCVVRIVSGNENRVFPGTRDVIVVEQSRVLDANPEERPIPRDVVLSPDRRLACPGPGSCGLSVTPATRAPRVAGTACFTVQIATAHDLLLGGDGLTVVVDRVRQPALRITINPSADLRLWFEQVDFGWLSIGANAAARVGGNGKIDFLSGGSSNSASAMYLHEFDARHIGISATTTGTRWSIRIGADTQASYHQPARAPGRIAQMYPIEIDGPIDRLEVPVGRVDPRPLSDATRAAARTLRDAVLTQAGPAPRLPAADPSVPSATAAAAALPLGPNERVAQVVSRYLPASVRITEIALWKGGGRLEGLAPDAATAKDITRRLTKSGEFTHVDIRGAVPRDGGFAFSGLMHFSCDAPGQPSLCPPGNDRRRPGTYTEDQISKVVHTLLGPTITVHDVRLIGTTINVEADAPNETEARAALERLAQERGLFRTSVTGYMPGEEPSSFEAKLKLICDRPPKPDGICGVQRE